MKDYYLAIDIGASNGRHILSYLDDNDKLVLEEIHRFENGLETRQNKLCWNLDKLFEEIVIGLKKCKEINKIPKSVGIDTWGVDFVLLDEHNNIIGDTVSYRDGRTEGMDEIVYNAISEGQLYEKTGIQKQIFNTIYQLMAIKTKEQNDMDRAETMLLIPDYFNFLLTGIKMTEYTNATTTGLVDPYTKNWNFELLNLLGYNKKIFTEIKTPTTVIGKFSKEMENLIGYTSHVVLPATHDTGSAVVTVPYTDNKSVYISSGTWSLMGVEEEMPLCGEDSFKLNFTNEGGINYRYRFLKNIMGLWLIQSVRKELDNKYSFSELCEMAESAKISSIIDCNDDELIAPDSMIDKIKEMCKRTNQQVPESAGEIANVVYNSLAVCYAKTVKDIESITKNRYENIYIIGGGAKAEYLNRLAKKHSNLCVKALPIEATAIGNILCQMISDNTFSDLFEARECVSNSFEIITY